MSIVYVRNQQTNEFEQVGSGTATTDTTLSQLGKPADASAVGVALAYKATKDYVDTKIGSLNNPNLLINGDFQIWQRGTSFTNIENTYTADRWLIKNATGSTALVERSDDIPSGEYLRQSMHITESRTENTYLRYMFENALKGTFTLSFWYKSNVGIHTYIYDSGSYMILDNLSACDDWTKVAFTFTATSLTFINIIHAMSAGDCYIAGVKLEYGSTSTVLMPRTGAEERVLCNRYFQKVNLNYVSGVSNNSGATVTFTYPAGLRDTLDTSPVVTMRQVPVELRTTDSDAVTTTITLNTASYLDGLILLTFNSSANLGARKVVWSIGAFEVFVDAEVY